jgi:hypothetical protein
VVRQWLLRLRPDPLRRLGLSEDDEAQVRQRTRPSAPQVAPAQRERVELAVREVTEASARGLPQVWAASVHSAAIVAGDELSEAIDRAVRSVDITMKPPGWWRGLVVLQTALVAVSVFGLVWWLLTFAGLPSPQVGGLSLAVLLLLDGVGLSAVVAFAGRWLALMGAQRRRRDVDAQMHSAVFAVAAERVITPVAAVLTDHRATRQALEGSR